MAKSFWRPEITGAGVPYFNDAPLKTPAETAKPTDKLAVQKLVRGEDGRQKLKFYDSETGVEIPTKDIQDGKYSVLTASGEYYVPEGKKDEEETKGGGEGSSSGRGLLERSGDSAKGHQESAGYAYNKAKEGYSKALGYINKPAWMGATNFIPGPIGKLSRVVNAGINLSNTMAVNEARKSIGLEPLGVKDTVKSVMKDQHGQIANVSYGPYSHQVGFEALSPQGNTNMTPDEAAKRAASIGATITERPGKYPNAETKKAGGLLTKASDAIGSIFSGTTVDAPSAVSSAPKGQSNLNISSPTSSVQTGLNSPSETGSRFGGVGLGTPAAKANTNIANAPDTFGKPSGRPNTQVQAAYGPARPNAPKDSTLSAVTRSVQNVLGGDYAAVGTSGMEGSLAQFGSNRHKTGTALDFSVQNMKTGAVISDPKTMEAIAKDLSYRNPDAAIGYDANGYMGPSSMHFDTTGYRTGTPESITSEYGNLTPGEVWGDKGTYRNADQSLIDSVAFGKNNPVTPNFAFEAPTARPNSVVDTRMMANSILSSPMVKDQTMLGQSFADTAASMNNIPANPGRGSSIGGPELSPTEHQSVLSGPQANQSFARNTVAASVAPSDNRFSGVSLKDAPAAQFASLGLTSRTTQEREALARALAGELSPSSLKALEANDPNARRELANMVTAVENRAAAAKWGSIEAAVTGSQVNSTLAENLGVTNNNYSLYSGVLSSAIGDYYAGALQPDNFSVTNWYNPDVVNPGWAESLLDPTTAGMHTFGTLSLASPVPDGSYLPGKDFSAMREAYGNAQISDTRGFTPSQNYSGGGYSSPSSSARYDSPSEGGSRFGGSGLGTSGGSSYSASGGRDSPSEGGSRFGGSGLGGVSSGDWGSGSNGGYSGGGSTNTSPSSGSRAAGGASDRGSVSGYSGGSGSSSSGGLGRNSDGSSNGWGGRSGPV